MKAISFSCKPDDKIYLEQVLPRLLSGEKTQTIRPMFCKDCMSIDDKEYRELIRSEHKSRYKIGDTVNLMWKQRTSPKDSWFCSRCGEEMVRKNKQNHNLNGKLLETFNWEHNPKCPIMINPAIEKATFFPKIIRTVKLTEVFHVEIQVVKDNYDGFGISVNGINKSGWDGNIDVLAVRDGFKNIKDMAMWFDQHYDLSTPKTFEVRRWQ